MKGIIVIVGLVLVGCSATKLNGSWARPDVEPIQYKNLVVLAMTPNISTRAVLEVAIANELKAAGIGATHSLDIFPLAGNEDVLKGFTDAEIKEAVTKKVIDNNVDALMIIALLDREKEQQYVQGNSVGVGMPYGGYGYGNPYYGYYGYAYGSVYSTPGYYKTTTTYLIEANLFDIETEQLIWSGQTTTTDPPELEYESNNYAKIVVRDMIKRNLINTKSGK